MLDVHLEKRLADSRVAVSLVEGAHVGLGVKLHLAGAVQPRRNVAHVCGHGRKLTAINGYYPQGENRQHATKFPAKEKYYADVLAYLNGQCSADDPVIVMGDMNVAPLDGDIGIGEPNRKRWLKDGKTSFLPEEREWLQKLVDWGMVDTYRAQYPHVDDLFSWFDYRSRGFEREPKRGLRIDLILASTAASVFCTDAGIDYEIRAMDRPSDHCPIWSELAL